MRFKREADAYGVATARNGVRPISRERCYLLLLLLLAIDDLSTRRRGVPELSGTNADEKPSGRERENPFE